MTLKKLSEITGYSVSTLSKVFSNSKEINESTKLEIIKKAKELGVYEKYAKLKYKKRIIAVVIPEMESAYYTGIVSELRKIITKKNATMIVSVSGFSKEEEQNLISFYSSNDRADGIIVVSGQTIAKKYSDTPIVYMGNHQPNDYADTINVDYFVGINEAILELKNLGHEKIAFIGEQLTKFRFDYFRTALKNNGLKVDESLIVKSNERFEQAGFGFYTGAWMGSCAA
jgi:LacI family transcriptional regulator